VIGDTAATAQGQELALGGFLQGKFARNAGSSEWRFEAAMMRSGGFKSLVRDMAARRQPLQPDKSAGKSRLIRNLEQFTKCQRLV
jgi:hypothetical protein